ARGRWPLCPPARASTDCHTPPAGQFRRGRPAYGRPFFSFRVRVFLAGGRGGVVSPGPVFVWGRWALAGGGGLFGRRADAGNGTDVGTEKATVSWERRGKRRNALGFPIPCFVGQSPRGFMCSIAATTLPAVNQLTCFTSPFSNSISGGQITLS